MGNSKNVIINAIEVQLHSEFVANDDNCYFETLPSGLYLNSTDTITFHYNYHGTSNGRACVISGEIFGSEKYTLPPNSSSKPIKLASPLNGRYQYNLTFLSPKLRAKAIVIDPEVIVDDHTGPKPKKRAAKKK